jgi:hypothetical protein
MPDATISSFSSTVPIAAVSVATPAPTSTALILTGPEEAYNNEAELWCARELLGVTVLHEGRLHLRIDPRRDGAPWLADVATLAHALVEAEERLAAY